MCKWSSGIPLIHFSVCEFFRLNPRFVSFSRAFAMVKETFKRIQKKWKGLIWSGKGWSKNKPTCKNAVSQTLYGSCTLRVMGFWRRGCRLAKICFLCNLTRRVKKLYRCPIASWKNNNRIFVSTSQQTTQWCKPSKIILGCLSRTNPRRTYPWVYIYAYIRISCTMYYSHIKQYLTH